MEYPAVKENDASVCTLKYIMLRTVYQLNILRIIPTSTEVKVIVYLLSKYSDNPFIRHLQLKFQIKQFEDIVRVNNVECDEILKLLIARKIIVQRKARHWIAFDVDIFSIPVLDLNIRYYTELFYKYIQENHKGYIIDSPRIKDLDELLECFFCFASLNKYKNIISGFMNMVYDDERLIRKETTPKYR